jgi:superfamily II DNA or RNA helicase
LQPLSAARPATDDRQEDQLLFALEATGDGPHKVLKLVYFLSRVLRNGGWSRVRKTAYFSTVDSRRLPAATVEALRFVETLADQGTSYGYYGNRAASVVLTGASGALALKLTAAAGRLFNLDVQGAPSQLLRVGPSRGLEWHWNEVTTLGSPEPLWALRAKLKDADENATCFANTPPLYIDATAGLCGVVEVPGLSAANLALLLKAPPIPQSDFDRHETTLLRRLVGLPLPPVIKTSIRVMQGVQPQAHLHISAVPSTELVRSGLLRAQLHFDYNGHQVQASNVENPVLLEQAVSAHEGALKDGESSDLPQRVLLHRALDAEQAALNALTELDLINDGQSRFHLPVSNASQQRWLHWMDEDFAVLREAGFMLSVNPDLHDWITRADNLGVQLAPQHQAGADEAGDDSQSPWFDLSLGMEVNGERHNLLPLLPDLLAQLDTREETGEADLSKLPKWVYLSQADGQYLRLPTEPLRPWLQALLDLVGDGAKLGGDALRLSRLEALRMGASLGEGVAWQGAQQLQNMVQQLTGRSALPIIAVPDGLQAELRPYQHHGLSWLQFLREHGLAGILADDMGLGKTLQTLTHLLVEKNAGRLNRPALIVCPVSVMSNWQREAARFTPQLSTLLLHGADRHEAASDIAHHDLVITPYSLLERDRDRWVEQPWHVVVLDEAHNIKNANTQAAQVVHELNARHRLCLTGTPIENHLGELWSLFHFLMPGFLSSQERFKRMFRTPIEKHGDPERMEQLRRRVTPFMLRRSKKEVATDLPEKQTTISMVELGDQQANLYETIRLTTEQTVRDALTSKGLAKSQILVLDALLKLRQVCCDPRLLKIDAARKVKQSAKLEQLMELLPELLEEGRRVLLFSQFTTMLSLIEDELKKRKISWVKLTGQSQKRDQLIERFTSGEVPLFLISLKAGGVGLNLTQADTVIHYDPWWNPAVENQATDRAHRIGQTEHVFVYKLVAQGTIEERMQALQKRKAALADSLYSAATARKQPLFTESDLAELLKPLG